MDVDRRHADHGVEDEARPEMAEAIENPGSVDMERPIGFGEPGHGAAPGGEPVAPPGESGGGPEVAPPGTEEGGNEDGPPAYHRQPPK